MNQKEIINTKFFQLKDLQEDNKGDHTVQINFLKKEVDDLLEEEDLK